MTTNWTQRLAVVSDEASVDFGEAIAICQPLGIRAYELRNLPGGRIPTVDDAVIDAVAALARQHDLALIGISPGFCKGAADEPLVELELGAGLDAACRVMDRLDVRRMTVFSYQRAGRDVAIPMRVLDLLGRAADRCRALGVELLLENSASCWGDTGTHLGQVARAVGVHCTWDPANAQASGEQAFPLGYSQVHDLVAHVHFKDWQPGAGWVDMGAGQIDLAGQVAALWADGYAGYYCVEPHQWQRRAHAVQTNSAYLRATMHAIEFQPQPHSTE